jgi:hypothetical protein
MHYLHVSLRDGRQEPWEHSPGGWPQRWTGTSERIRTNGRPIAQWSRLKAGHSDDLGTGSRCLSFCATAIGARRGTLADLIWLDGVDLAVRR